MSMLSTHESSDRYTQPLTASASGRSHAHQQRRDHRSYIKRDRHGRGIRGPIVQRNVPAWRSRAQMFDDVIAWDLGTFRRHLGARMDRFDFAVLDVPHSDPAPWEDGIPLGRIVPFEKPSKIEGRIIFYRMPIIDAASRHPQPRLYIHNVITNQLASALGERPEDIDYLS